MSAHVDLIAEKAFISGSRKIDALAVVFGGQRDVVVRFGAQAVVSADHGGLPRDRHRKFHIHLLQRRSPVAAGVIRPERTVTDRIFGRQLRRDAPSETVVVVAPHAGYETERMPVENFVLDVQRSGGHAFRRVETERIAIQVETQPLIDHFDAGRQPVVLAGLKRPQQTRDVVRMPLLGNRRRRKAVQVAVIAVVHERQVNLIVPVRRVLHLSLHVVAAVRLVGPRFRIVRHRVLVEDAAVEIVAVLAEITSGHLKPELIGQFVIETLADIDVAPPADAQSPLIGRNADRRIAHRPSDDEYRHAGRRIHLRTHTDDVAFRPEHRNHLRRHHV